MADVKKEYAGALFKLAQESGLTEEICGDMRSLRQLLAENEGYVRLLSAPNIKREERIRLLDEALRDQVQTYTLNFMKLLIERGYFAMFPACCDTFISQYNEANGIEVVTVTTTVPLTDAQRERLTAQLSQKLGRRIELHETTDPSLIGGVRLEMRGRLMDASIKARLAAVRESLNSTVL